MPEDHAHQSTIVIVYHSAMGHTRAIAESVARGAAGVDGVGVELLDVTAVPSEVDETRGPWALIKGASAMVMGSPTYMGCVSAPFKAFMDSTGSIWYRRGWMNKLAAGFTVGAGLAGDKQGTLRAMHTFASQHGMLWVSLGVGVGEDGLDRFFASLGLMAQADNAPAEVTPPAEDHATAEAFGARVARAALRWDRGQS